MEPFREKPVVSILYFTMIFPRKHQKKLLSEAYHRHLFADFFEESGEVIKMEPDSDGKEGEKYLEFTWRSITTATFLSFHS
jgi:hypothetical protein